MLNLGDDLLAILNSSLTLLTEGASNLVFHIRQLSVVGGRNACCAMGLSNLQNPKLFF
ncbi:hypothetical protein D3C85_1784950 [compost metagenome]